VFEETKNYFEALNKFLNTLKKIMDEPGIEIYYSLDEMYTLIVHLKSIYFINEKFREAFESFREGESAESIIRTLGDVTGGQVVDDMGDVYLKSVIHAEEIIKIIHLIELRFEGQLGDFFMNNVTIFIILILFYPFNTFASF